MDSDFSDLDKESMIFPGKRSKIDKNWFRV